MAQRGSKDTKTTHEGFKITRKKDAHRLATRVSCQTSVPSGFNTAMKQCNALIRNIGQTKTRSTNPESIVFSRDPAYLQRHNRSLQESHKIRFEGGMTKPKTRGKEMKDSASPSFPYTEMPGPPIFVSEKRRFLKRSPVPSKAR